MILYHFTAMAFRDEILERGLTKGRIEISETEDKPAINLTSSQVPAGMGIGEGPVRATDADRKRLRERFGLDYPRGAWWPDLRTVRFKVEIEDHDPRLVKWSEFRAQVARETVRRLEHRQRPSTWWLYFGQIPPSMFRAVDYRHGIDYRDHPPVGKPAVIRRGPPGG
jgi:hypothetical protein